MRPVFLIALLCPFLAHASGKILTVEYPPSQNPGELIYPVTYRMWIPDGVEKIRAVIVHQHGCGAGSAKDGMTAADDLHWQALAKKWDAALLGPSYHMQQTDEIRKWCDPRNGSEKTFLRCLSAFAKQSGHPEIETVPWCLWGHSGGGFWSSLMLTLHPDRIAAIWFRSGSAFGAWEKGEIQKPELNDAVFRVPVMFNGGVKEANDPKHGPARVNDRAMFQLWRACGAPAGMAPDPLTGHECGDSRYLAIPFLDACLAMRLPEKGGDPSKLKPVDLSLAWLATESEDVAQPAASFTGNMKSSTWLPNESVAHKWMEYIKTGYVSDTTSPPAPTKLVAKSRGDAVGLRWEAEADVESGLQQFIIERNGVEIGRVPEKMTPKSGRALFQRKTYGDTVEFPLQVMRFADTNAPLTTPSAYRVFSVNSSGLRSNPSAEAKPEFSR